MQGPNADTIKDMFGTIATKYDSANTVLSAGIHHLWKKKLVRLSGASANSNVLDCATGTGDLALEFAKAVGPLKTITATDFCPEMLAVAKTKAKAQDNINFEIADVTNLQFGNSQFDICSIAFGIRNVSNPSLALKEMSRVVKSGGKVLVLEFGQPVIPGFKEIYNLYSSYILPTIGGLITGQSSAYRYLQKSSAAFPCGKKFVELMSATQCFSHCECITLSGGIAYIYIGTVK